MTLRWWRVFPWFVLLFALQGCVIRHGDFTVLSNNLVRLSDFELSKARRTHDIAGKDVQHIVIIFPASGPPSLEGAIDDALKRGRGDLLTDATVYWYQWYIPFIYGQVGWTVTGDVVRTRKN